ncbi:dienelactone hydrolase [Kitasatospora sp. MAA4]|uniref:alpha/beta hydrolase n=1 Tax=Kitasatospora sp. MAA4 TaxID=3035093 RepID=UPI002474791D|nr:alpha/beta fold hydrolase [Kitasatospora sp. MAA4]MDH6133059.1 dienelactone hydrolase [Kitasatospora sp. MAA4]
MTTFVLVPGAHTGGWIWEEVAAGLRESGAEAHPVTFDAAGPDTDLATHAAELVQLIDAIDASEAPEVVLVGHCYGIHPALGAASRRPERIARIVHLDVGIPQDGDPPLQLLRAQLGDWNPESSDRLIPPPTLDGWQRWGSTADLPAPALARLTSLATPQPLRTLTQPLRLSDAARALPTTGVLCTGNGATIATVEARVRLGDPDLKVLTEPRVTLLELDSGHWPMLSRPAELAELLLRAAAGEGHRVTEAADEVPAHLRPFLLDVPQRPRERLGHVDLHLPDADHPRPAVLFVHGGPLPAGTRPSDWPTFVGYGQYVANRGAVGAAVNHRLHGLTDFHRAAEDVAAAVDLLRADPRVDAERIALWFFSGGGLLSADWLAAPPPWLKCVAANYPVLAPPPNWGLAATRFHPATALRTAGRLPVVLTRPALDYPEFAATVDTFLAAAHTHGTPVDTIEIPGAHHAFESLDHTPESRAAVTRAVHLVLTHLAS